jgi:hypothetical protein
MEANPLFGSPIAASLGSFSERSNQIGPTLFFVNANTIEPGTSNITINFDCKIHFDPNIAFCGFDITISNCSV